MLKGFDRSKKFIVFDTARSSRNLITLIRDTKKHKSYLEDTNFSKCNRYFVIVYKFYQRSAKNVRYLTENRRDSKIRTKTGSF